MAKHYKDVFKYWMLEEIPLDDLGIPILYPAVDLPKKVISFNYVNSSLKKADFNHKDYYVHFYIDDYQFERVWFTPLAYVEVFKRFGGIIMPDYSIYDDLPLVVQQYNLYRSRLLAAYYQKQGIDVIANVTWSDEASLDWSLSGLPNNVTIALSTNGCLNKDVKTKFLTIYDKVIKMLNPSNVILVGSLPDELSGDNRVIHFNGHIERFNGGD